MNFLSKSIIFHFGCLWLCSCGVILLAEHYILTPEFFVNNNQALALSPAENMTLYERMQRWSYIYQVFYYLLKLIVIAGVLHTSMFFSGLKLSFRKAFLVVTIAEYIFIAQALLKVVWFYLKHPHGTLAEWHSLYLLSAASLFEHLPANWIFPLSVLNVFEIGYCFLLAYGLSRISLSNFDQSLKVVIISYIPALMVWVVATTFCSLLFFPSHS